MYILLKKEGVSVTKYTMTYYIKDIPNALKKVYSNRFEFLKIFKNIFEKNNYKRIYFLGSGTSYHASQASSIYFNKYTSIESFAMLPTRFVYDNKIPSNLNKNEVLIVGISQSGTSVSVIRALDEARNNGYYTVGITENLNSELKDHCDELVHLLCGEELIGPETRGYSVTLYQMYLTAIEIGRFSQSIDFTTYHNLLRDAKDLADSLDEVIDTSMLWYKKHEKEFIENMKISAISGYGNQYVTAQESWLKVYETVCRPCAWYEMEEMMHGPMGSYTGDYYIFAIVSEGPQKKRFKDFEDYGKRITDHFFIFTAENDIGLSKNDLKFPCKFNESLDMIMYVVPFQIIASELCYALGMDPNITPHGQKSPSHSKMLEE